MTYFAPLGHNEAVSIGSFIHFFNTHNQLIFGVTLAMVLALSSYLLYRIFFTDSQSETMSANDGAQIEETLKKVLAQTSILTGASNSVGSGSSLSTDASAGAGGGGGTSSAAAMGGPAVPPAELEKLKAEIAANQNLITELKQKAEQAVKSQMASDQTPELLAKVKVLENRLAEYEIIEDDIADLSIYKEENAKLKKELELLKASSGPVLKNEAATTAVDSVMAPVPTPAATSAPAPAPTPAPAVAAAPAQATPTPPASAASAPASAPAASVPNDIFSEFQGQEGGDVLAELGDLDADRMLEEIKDLGEAAGADAGVLDEAVDVDKMAAETNKG